MNPYLMLGPGVDTNEATSLSARLSAWHDAMVVHERRLRTGTASDVCDDECPHAEAPALWSEALDILGPRAQELTFLRSRAKQSTRHSAVDVPSRASVAAPSGRRVETGRERRRDRAASIDGARGVELRS